MTGFSPAGQLYGLEKFWAFLKYSKMKNQTIDPKLKEHLSQFKKLEDFRVVVSDTHSLRRESHTRSLESSQVQEDIIRNESGP